MSGTTFITKLFSDSNEVSSKRIISFFSFLLFFYIVIYSVINGIKLDSTIIYALISLILGSSAMTLITNKNDTNKE